MTINVRRNEYPLIRPVGNPDIVGDHHRRSRHERHQRSFGLHRASGGRACERQHRRRSQRTRSATQARYAKRR